MTEDELLVELARRHIVWGCTIESRFGLEEGPQFILHFPAREIPVDFETVVAVLRAQGATVEIRADGSGYVIR